MVQMKIQNKDYTNELRTQEMIIMSGLEDSLHKDKFFWKDKARLNQHLEGNRNTNFFYILARLKHATKTIYALKVDGMLNSDHDVLGSHVVDYYKSVLSYPQTLVHDQDLTNYCIPYIINKDISLMLVRTPSVFEIKEDVFNLYKERSSSPCDSELSFIINFGKFFNTVYVLLCCNY